jgi:hypothetical protein
VSEERWPPHWVDDLADERAATKIVEELAEVIAQVAPVIWRIGDGEGGFVRGIIEAAFARHGLLVPKNVVPQAGKKPVPAKLRWEVFKRDDFRCVTCGSRDDLAADHVVPESAGGEATLENLQTLCRSCNSRKGSRP